MVTLGVGVASLAGALGFELARASAEDAARDAPDQVAAVEHADTMTDYRTAARVFVGIGAGTMLAGGVLLALDLLDAWPQDEGEEARARVVLAPLSCGTSGCAIALGGAF